MKLQGRSVERISPTTTKQSLHGAPGSWVVGRPSITMIAYHAKFSCYKPRKHYSARQKTTYEQSDKRTLGEEIWSW